MDTSDKKRLIYTKKGIEQLRDKIARALNVSELNGWEQGFLQNIDEFLYNVLNKPGQRWRMMSDRQENRLIEIFEEHRIPYAPVQTEVAKFDLGNKSPSRRKKTTSSKNRRRKNSSVQNTRSSAKKRKRRNRVKK